jgi:hypothetical protein
MSSLNPLIDTNMYKQKRLRNLSSIHMKNLKINSCRFKVWFTLHLNRDCRSFFISEKKENDRRPKWILQKKDTSKYACKEFLIRVWYSNLEDISNLNPINDSVSENGLNLILEMDVNLDYLCKLSDQNVRIISKSTKKYSNFLIFELFGENYCEYVLEFASPLVSNKKQRNMSINENRSHKQIQQKLTVKNSYTLNSMIRIIDFQRVIHETQEKMIQVRLTSQIKYEKLSKLREIQIQREECLQRMSLYKSHVYEIEKNILNLVKDNETIRVKNNSLREKNACFKDLEIENEKKLYQKMQQEFELIFGKYMLFNNRLLLRQKHLVLDLADIFRIVREDNENRDEIIFEQNPIIPNSNTSKLQILNSNLVLRKISNIITTNIKNNSSERRNNGVVIAASTASDDEENSVSLGHIVHCLRLLADLLCIPLRYPLLYRSSKSYIIEQLNDLDVRKLPLFKSNVSDEVFMYAIGLLNLNILQLRAHIDRNFKQYDQFDLLINLKAIFDFYKK